MCPVIATKGCGDVVSLDRRQRQVHLAKVGAGVGRARVASGPALSAPERLIPHGTHHVLEGLGGVHTALLVLAAIPATWTLTRILDGWVLLAALVVLGLLLVVVGDLVPRKLGRDRPGALAYRFAGLLKGAVALGAAATDFIDDLDDDVPVGAGRVGDRGPR